MISRKFIRAGLISVCDNILYNELYQSIHILFLHKKNLKKGNKK